MIKFEKLKRRFLPLLLFLTLIFLTTTLLIVGVTKGWYQQFLDNNVLSSKSRALLGLNGDILELDFKITEKDKPKVDYFLKKLQVSDDVYQGIRLEIDQSFADTLQKFLPTTVDLDFGNDKLIFRNKQFPTLNSSLSQSKYEYSSGSAKLVVKSASERAFNIEITDPKRLVESASASSHLYVSSKIEQLFPILGRIGTIKLDIDGKNLNGEISLK